MVLTERQTKILNILYKNRQDFLSSQEIANRIGVTNKTIQSDINTISVFLNKLNISISSARGKGYKIDSDGDYHSVDIANSLSDINDVDEIELQISWIACYLIMKTGYITQREIMDYLVISSGQFKLLFPRLVQELTRHKLSISSTPGYGFLLEGEEINKRIAYVHFYSLVSHSKYYRRMLDEEIKYSLREDGLMSIKNVIELVEKHNFRIDDINVTYLLQFIRFSKYRSCVGKGIDSLQVGYVVENELLDLAKELLDFTDSLSPFYASKKDCEYEEFHLAAYLKLVVFESSLVNIMKMSAKDAQIINRINNFLSKRNSLFVNTVDNIDELQREITNALILISCKNSVGFRDSVSGISNFEHDDEFFVATEYAILLTFKLESDLGIEFYKDDIFRLGMIFNVHFKLNVWDVNKHILITSKGSRTQQRYIARKILSEIPSSKVDIVDNIESIDILSIQPHPIVITDDQFCVLDRKIRVGNFKSLIQSNEILDFVKYIDTDFDLSKNRFLSLFSKQRFTFVELKKRNEIVNWICKKYDCDQERTTTIQSNVFIRESRYYPTVFNGIAFPKIYVESVKYPQIEVIKLNNQVLWNGNPIRMVMAYILPNTYDSLTVLGKPFSEISTNVNLLNDLVKSQTYEDFYLCLSKKMK